MKWIEEHESKLKEQREKIDEQERKLKLQEQKVEKQEKSFNEKVDSNYALTYMLLAMRDLH